MTGEAQSASKQHRYRILLELGEGGTAHVFLAIAKGPSGFNKLVVLKALKRTLAGDENFRRMFMNEARLSARLNHPNIVQVNEVIEQDGLPIIVMQYLEGRPLLDLIFRAGDKLSLGLHLQIINEVLSGLHYSHELCDFDGTPLRVVHRDVTPHNIFVTFDGQVKLLDFGIAKLSGSAAETQDGVLKGKIRYMAPEQLLGDPVDRRADIYAVGVLLWEAVTRTRMWQALPEAAILNRVLEGQVPLLRAENPEIDAELERIVMKALAKNAEDRYETVLALQSELEAHMNQRRLGASPREIAGYITELFADYRQETKKSIEEKLVREGSLSWVERDPISIAPSADVSPQSKQLLAPQGKHDWSRVFWTAGVAVPAALLVFFISVWRHEPRPTPARAQPVVTPSVRVDEPTLDARRTMASIRISAIPTSASILIDGKPVRGNPVTLPVSIDSQTHRVTVQASEYRPRTIDVSYDRDQDIVVALERISPPNAAQKAPSRNSSAALPAASVTPPKDCDSPSFVDERGIKHFKAGCL